MDRAFLTRWLLICFTGFSGCGWLLSSVTYSTNTTLNADDRLSGSYSVTLNGNLTLNGSGFTYFFPNSTSPVFIVNNGFTATVTNLLFNNVLGEHFSLGVGSSLVFGAGCILRLLDNDVLSYGWTFGGATTLDGRGHILDLGSSGSITVQAGGTLTLTNLTLKGLSTTNLNCADKTAKIVFDNVELVVPVSYNFSLGSFSVNRRVVVSGGGVFNYQSSYSSTILSNSTLRLTDTVTFKYNPALASGATVASKTNLVFTDKTAHLALDSATLRVTTTGMQLTVGTLEIYNRNIVHCDAPVSDYAHGLLLGNNSPFFDLAINIGAEAVLEVEAGPLVYQNEGVVPPLLLGPSYPFALQNVADGSYLYTCGNVYNVSGFANPYSVIMIGTVTTKQTGTSWYCSDGSLALSSTSNYGNVVNSGSTVYVHNSVYTYSSSVKLAVKSESSTSGAIVSSPSPPYNPCDCDNAGSGDSDASKQLTITKVAGSGGVAINYGDTVSLFFDATPDRKQFVYSTGLTYSQLSAPIGPFGEVCAYRTGNISTSPPSVNKSYWTIVSP